MSAYIIGTACTSFGKRPQQSFKSLTREVLDLVLADAGFDDGHPIDGVWFSNVKMDMYGQPNIRGQIAFSDITAAGLMRDRVPYVNVEGACASGSLAFHGAWKDVLSGLTDVALAIGVEKTYIPDDPKRQYALFTGGEDRLEPENWHRYFEQVGTKIGRPWSLNDNGGTLNMDTYAMQASYHMAKYGTTQRQLAMASSKDHHHGSLNPLAQYRFETSVDQVLADRPVSYPLTRAMCSPIGDGAAAAIVVSEKFFRGLPAHVRQRAVKLRASALGGGKYRDLDEPSVSHVTAQRAYRQAGLTPGDVHVAEVHDATSFGEIYQPEMMGFCEFGGGGRFVESGATSLGGKLPVNLSGGLVSKGHPVGATGLSMIYELGLQLRGEAGPRQAQGARIGLAQNGGGTIGFDDAVCAVTLLEAP